MRPADECSAEQPAVECSAQQHDLLDGSYEMCPAEERSAEQHALSDESFETCPQVAAILDSIDVDVLEWILQEFLWDQLGHYGSSDDGTIRRDATRTYTAEEKLENLFKESKKRRGLYCANLTKTFSHTVNFNRL